MLSVQLSPALESVLCDYIVDALDAQLHRLAFGARGDGALVRADDAEELEMVREALAAVAGLPPALQERIVRKLRGPSQVLLLALDRGLRSALTASVPTRSHLEFAAPVLEWAASETASAAHEWWRMRKLFTVRFEKAARSGSSRTRRSSRRASRGGWSEGWRAGGVGFCHFSMADGWVPEPEEAWVAFAETLPARMQRLLDGCARLLGDGDDGAIDGDTSFIFADFLDEKLRYFFFEGS